MKIYIFQFTFLFFLLCQFNIGNSQSKSINYQILEDEPAKKNLIINILPVSFAFGGYSVGMGIGFDAEYTYENLATFQFSALQNLYGTNSGTEKDLQGNNFILEPFGQFELGGFYHFKNDISDDILDVTLSSYSSGKTTYSKYISVPAHRQIIWGPKLSYMKYHEPIVLDELNSNMSVNAISIGAIRRGRTYLIVKTDYAKSKRRNAGLNDFYFDLLFNVKTSYDNVSSYPDTRKIGCRLGWNYIIIRSLGLSSRFEIGILPGIKSKSGFFFNWRVGLPIGIKTIGSYKL